MSDFESGEADAEFPQDWRGHDIGVYTPIVWRQGATSAGKWKIGVVTRVYKDEYRGWLLDVQWTEESWTYAASIGNARGVRPHNVMVFREAAQ